MRSLIDLNIHHLRNISSASLSLHPHNNLFYGSNGSGKTSLLEAIYLLGTGHSFRTRETVPLVTHGAAALTVFARTADDETISIQKKISGSTHVKLNRETCYSSSALSRFLPCQVFYQDIFQVIDAGPAVRRAVLDWGLFHVEPSYHLLWKDYRLVIKHRNALLRQKAAAEYFVPWDKQLVHLALALDAMRAAYFQRWSILFQSILQQLSDVPCHIEYYKGWDRKGSGMDLSQILQDQLNLDRQRLYTHAGAHQADILFDLSSKKAKQLLSRGQQKIVLIALKLAQASLVPMDCIYLFDDIAAELDADHLSRLMLALATVKGQKFFTAIDEMSFKKYNRSLEWQMHQVNEGAFVSKINTGT